MSNVKMSELDPPITTNTPEKVMIDKLRLELEKRDEEIFKLREQLMNKIGSSSAKVREDNNPAIITDKEVLFHGTKEDSNPAIIVDKEVLFHGTKEDDKPCKNKKRTVIQMHYTITYLSSSSSSSSPFVVEDSRERRNGQPFECISDQIMEPWETIIREMCRGEVLLVKMKLDSDVDYFLPAVTAAANSSPPSHFNDNVVYQCRIELIDFWEYEEPFRPWILSKDNQLQR